MNNFLFAADCMNQSKINTFYLLGLGVFILRIAVPVVLLIFGITDLIKVMTRDSEKEMISVIKRLGIKFVLAALVFLLPTFILILLKLTNTTSDKADIEFKCVLNATSSKCRSQVNFNYISDPIVCYGEKNNSGDNQTIPEDIVEIEPESSSIQKECTLRWDFNGGTDSSGNKELVGAVPCGKESVVNTSPKSITKEGYEFDNKWLVDCDWDCSMKGQTYDINVDNPLLYTSQGNTTLRAVWKKK